MKINQLKELLDYLANARLSLAKLYNRLGNNVNAECSKLVFQFLEQSQYEAIGRFQAYREIAPESVLNLCYKNINVADIEKECDIQIAADALPDSSLDIYIRFENLLTGYLEQAAIATNVAEGKIALEGLVSSEIKQQLKIVNALNRSCDM